MKKLTLSQAASGLAKGEFTAARLTADALSQIADEQGEGRRTFTHVYAQWAQEQALVADRRRAAGNPLSALDGVPVSVKDLFDVAGKPPQPGRAYWPVRQWLMPMPPWWRVCCRRARW